jgi:hypothetical protein
MRFQNRCHRGKALHQIRAVFETLFDVAALWKMREPLLLIRVSPTARLLQSSPNRCAFTHNLIDSHKCSMERHCPHGDRCRLARFNPPLDRMLKIAKRHAAAPSATPSASESEPEPEDRENQPRLRQVEPGVFVGRPRRRQRRLYPPPIPTASEILKKRTPGWSRFGDINILDEVNNKYRIGSTF